LDTINMPEANGDANVTILNEPEKEYPAELKAILERGNAGDPTVLAALRQALADNPALVATLGDLAKHAEQSLLRLVAGTSLTAREAVPRQMADMRQRLLTAEASELEKLIIERICISWLHVYYADTDQAFYLFQGTGATPGAKAAQQRLDRAHARYLCAIRALATVRKLLKPPLSTVDMLRRTVAETAVSEEVGSLHRSRGRSLPAAAN
jgi:hypothetical protein